jgi:hypothetical protein
VVGYQSFGGPCRLHPQGEGSNVLQTFVSYRKTTRRQNPEGLDLNLHSREDFNPHKERFDLKKLNEVEVKEKYQVEISNRFATLESLDQSFDINNAWESIRENIKTSAKENLGYQKLKHNKPWFDHECSKLIDQRKQAKLQWLQIPNQTNRDNLQNVRHETSRVFRKRKGGI